MLNIVLLKFYNKCNNFDDVNSKIVLDVLEEFLKLFINLCFIMGFFFDDNYVNLFI